MVLNAKDGLGPVAQTLYAAVVKIKVGYYYVVWQAATGYGKTVVMTGNRYRPTIFGPDRLVTAPVTKL
jgi:hypothetical protein